MTAQIAAYGRLVALNEKRKRQRKAMKEGKSA